MKIHPEFFSVDLCLLRPSRPLETTVLASRQHSQITRSVVSWIPVLVRHVLTIPLLDPFFLDHSCTGRVPRCSVLLLLWGRMVVVVLGSIITSHGCSPYVLKWYYTRMNLQNQHYRAHTPQPYHIKGGCGGSVPAKCCSVFAAVTPVGGLYRCMFVCNWSCGTSCIVDPRGVFVIRKKFWFRPFVFLATTIAPREDRGLSIR